MRLDDFLNKSVAQLSYARVATARLDALVLLEDVLQYDRSHLLAHPELILTHEQKRALNDLIGRRATHEPLAYIRQKTEFYGREFFVDKRVLEPRPESEAIIDALKTLLQNDGTPQAGAIIDVGTGSGALAITAKLELPDARMMGVDINTGCLAVAAQNVERHSVNIELLESDLLASVSADALDRAILLCNLPYVPDDFQINQAAEYEPKLAIFGGPDGLDLYRKLFEQITQSPTKPEYILSESLPASHQALQSIATHAGFMLTTAHDFVQVFERVPSGQPAGT